MTVLLYRSFCCNTMFLCALVMTRNGNDASKIAENHYFGPKSGVRTNLAKNGARSVVRTNLQDFRSAG